MLKRFIPNIKVFFAGLAIVLGSFTLIGSVAAPASAGAATSCHTITVIHRGTHMVFLWKRVRIDKHGRRFVKREHIWRSRTVIVRGKKVTKKIPVKARRRYAIKLRREECVVTTTTAAPTTTTAAPAVQPNPISADLSLSTNTVSYIGGSVGLTYTSDSAASCSLSSTPALWSGNNPAAVSCNGSYSLAIDQSASGGQWTITFTATGQNGQSVSDSQVLTQDAPPPFNITPNWSGYVVPSATAIITDVSGNWTVPTLNCNDTQNATESDWVGIGGAQSGTNSGGVLLQTGIDNSCVNGIQESSGWWEEFPSNPNYGMPFSNFPVSPGDNIQASVFENSGGSWTTLLENLSTGLEGIMVTGEGWGVAPIGATGFSDQGTTTNVSYAGGYTAEWIVEDPTGSSGNLVPFANYGSVTFTNLGTSLNPWYLTASEGYAIQQNGSVLSVPSLPGSDGFSVYYTGP